MLRDTYFDVIIGCLPLLCAGMEPASRSPHGHECPHGPSLHSLSSGSQLPKVQRSQKCKRHPGCLEMDHARFGFWFFSVYDQRELAVSESMREMGIIAPALRGCGKGVVKLKA